MQAGEALKKTAKFGVSAGLSAAIIATHAAKYGASFGIGATKVMMNGVTSMAESLVGGSVKIGVGDALLDGVEKLSDKGFNQLLNGLKNLKGRV